jgi:hypothetical protein
VKLRAMTILDSSALRSGYTSNGMNSRRDAVRGRPDTGDTSRLSMPGVQRGIEEVRRKQGRIDDIRDAANAPMTDVQTLLDRGKFEVGRQHNFVHRPGDAFPYLPRRHACSSAARY